MTSSLRWNGKGAGWALAAAALLASACAPGIQVTRLKPARYNLGAARRMAVLQVNGSGEAAALVMNSLQREIVERRYYSLINAVNQGISIVVPGANARIDIGGVTGRVDADAYVTANVLRYEVIEVDREEEKTENGRKVKYPVIRPEAHTRINFQVVRRDGQVVVFRDYAGDHTGDSLPLNRRHSYSRADLLERAINDAVDDFMGDVTPRQVVEKIELDESEPSLKTGVRLAADGDLRGAELSWSGVLQQDPNNAGAIYNLGVLLETRGDFDAAAASYRRAFELKPKPLYRSALEQLEQRLRDAQALQQPL